MYVRGNAKWGYNYYLYTGRAHKTRNETRQDAALCAYGVVRNGRKSNTIYTSTLLLYSAERDARCPYQVVCRVVGWHTAHWRIGSDRIVEGVAKITLTRHRVFLVSFLVDTSSFVVRKTNVIDIDLSRINAVCNRYCFYFFVFNI